MTIFIDQLLLLTMSNIKARYRKTFAGFLWVVLNPIILYSVQSVVFKKILRLNVENYTIFLLSGLLPWIFITTSLDMGIPYLTHSQGILKAFKVNPLVLILSQVLDNFINFLFAFFIILIPLLFTTEATLNILLLPIPIFNLLLSVASLTILGSLMNVFFRDTRFLTSFLLNILYFVTPIFYPIEFVPRDYVWLVKLNPLFHLIHSFRMTLYDFNAEDFWWANLYSFIIGLVLISFASFYWSKKKGGLYYAL